MRKLCLLGLLLFFCACSPYKLTETKVPNVAPFGLTPPDLGTICVVRPAPVSNELTFLVRDNEQLVGATRGPSYFCYLAEPGEHHLVSTTGRENDAPGTASITVTGGKRYYVHQDFAVVNVWGTVIDRLRWIAPELAGEYIDDCEYKVLASVPGTETLPGAAPIARAASPARVDERSVQ